MDFRLLAPPTRLCARQRRDGGMGRDRAAAPRPHRRARPRAAPALAAGQPRTGRRRTGCRLGVIAPATLPPPRSGATCAMVRPPAGEATHAASGTDQKRRRHARRRRHHRGRRGRGSGLCQHLRPGRRRDPRRAQPRRRGRGGRQRRGGGRGSRPRRAPRAGADRPSRPGAYARHRHRAVASRQRRGTGQDAQGPRRSLKTLRLHEDVPHGAGGRQAAGRRARRAAGVVLQGRRRHRGRAGGAAALARLRARRRRGAGDRRHLRDRAGRHAVPHRLRARQRILRPRDGASELSLPRPLEAARLRAGPRAAASARCPATCAARRASAATASWSGRSPSSPARTTCPTRIANLEAHHFKYALFRRPGDVHVHFFGTATLSFSDAFATRPGDVFEITAAPFTLPLRNRLEVQPAPFAHIAQL